MQREQQLFLDNAAPHLDRLLELAGHDLRYHEARGDVPEGELSPEEVAGETLLRAFYERERKPDGVSMLAWLFATEARVMTQLLDDDARERQLWAASLDERLPEPPPPYGDDTFWDWHQPDEVQHIEDALRDSVPPPEQIVAAAEEYTQAFPPALRRAWLLHDMHGLSVREIVGILRHDAEDVAAMIRKVRDDLTSAARS